MDRNQTILMIVTVIAIGLIFYFFGTEPDKTVIKEGKYFDESGNLLGSCLSKNIEKEFVTTVEFYDLNEKLVGKCSEYYGPGSSGWKGGCDEESLASGVAYRIGSGIYEGRIARKYSCLVE